MARKIFGPRKQRTRQHVIADLSVNYVERFILDEGHIAQRMEKDYGYDLLLFTFDEQGFVEPGLIRLQLKAAETLQSVRGDYVFDLDIRDYNLWMLEEMPVILILFDASRRRAFWLPIQRYFREEMARQLMRGARTVRVRVPARQAVSRRAVSRMRNLKEDVLREPKEEQS
jgi:hypothetical protein